MDLNNLVDFEGLSTEAKIGKIVVLVAFVLKIIGILFSITAFSLGPYAMMFAPIGLGAFWTGIVAGLVVLSLIGLFLIWKTFEKMASKDFHGAAIYALIAAFLPPIDIIVLIGSIILFVSPEAKKK
ncbi:MAG: hypothetical protein J7K72_00590 [Candidatus Aenigmarchaeota archaeon]|nr:hypothetical protein [Candidatus Aenigmarchaeota archaeon]